MDNNEEQMGFHVEITDEHVKVLHYAVSEAIRVWPGSPARPAEEQETLLFLKDRLFRMVLEANLDL